MKPNLEETVRELVEPAVVAAGARELLVLPPGVLVVYARVSWELNASLILLPGEARGRHLARAPVEEAPLWLDVAHAVVSSQDYSLHRSRIEPLQLVARRLHIEGHVSHRATFQLPGGVYELQQLVLYCPSDDPFEFKGRVIRTEIRSKFGGRARVAESEWVNNGGGDQVYNEIEI